MKEFWFQMRIIQKNALNFLRLIQIKYFGFNIEPTIDCKFTEMELEEKLMKFQ